MIELMLPRDLDTLEIAVRLRRDVTRRDSMIGLRITDEVESKQVPGWPIYEPVGFPAKYISLGAKGDVQKFATVRAGSLSGCKLTIDLITEENRPAAVAVVGVLGKSSGNQTAAWRFEV